jgi:hypothetical protein
MYELGPQATAAHDTKRAQKHVPRDQPAPQVILLARSHEPLAEKNAHQIDACVTNGHKPVRLGPVLFRNYKVPVEELSLVEEQERVVHARFGAVDSVFVAYRVTLRQRRETITIAVCHLFNFL